MPFTNRLLPVTANRFDVDTTAKDAAVALGRLGGLKKSPRKAASSARNLELARRKKAGAAAPQNKTAAAPVLFIAPPPGR